MIKPFSPREIVYRVKAQLRRQQYQSDRSADLNSLLTVGFLALDKESCRIYKKGQEIELTGREFLLLSYLMENTDKIISKERLYDRYGANTAAFVIIRSWCISVISEKRLKILRLPQNN